jgi:hypothetical protein
MSSFYPNSPSRNLLSKSLMALSLLLCSPALATFAIAQTAAPAAKPAPDVLVFTNGDQLSGTVLRGVGDSIVFKSDMAGEINVPLAKIKELRSAASFAIVRKDVPVKKTTVPQTGTIAVADGNLTVNSSTSAPQSIPDKELAYIVDAPTFTRELAGHQSIREGWTGSITAGATLVRATQNGTTFTAGVTAVRATPSVAYIPRRNRTLFNLIESYGKLTQPTIPQTTPATPDSIAKTNIFHSDVEQDKYFTPHFYVLATAAFDHNFSQGLNLQQIYGAGVGWTPIQTPKQQLDFTANVHYEKQGFQDPTSNQNLIGATVADAYMRQLPGKLVFTQFANFLPAFNNSNAYSANFGAGLALPVYHRFSVSLNTSDNYLNNPSAGYKKNSYQFVTGLTYTLH